MLKTGQKLGGMGAVYLAQRAAGKFKQKVAVKMLKHEFNVEKIRRNFRRESEIQSKLNHPNIALLLDAGKTDDCVLYLVMEEQRLRAKFILPEAFVSLRSNYGTNDACVGKSPVAPNCWINIPAVER